MKIKSDISVSSLSTRRLINIIEKRIFNERRAIEKNKLLRTRSPIKNREKKPGSSSSDRKFCWLRSAGKKVEEKEIAELLFKKRIPFRNSDPVSYKFRRWQSYIKNKIHCFKLIIVQKSSQGLLSMTIVYYNVHTFLSIKTIR